jgi:hypothetical protein
VPDHLADELPKVREQRGQRGRRGRGPTAYEAICLTSGMSSASTGIICSVRSVCALHTTHCRPNVTFRIGLSGNNLWKGAVNLAGAQRDRGVQGLGGLGVGGMGQAAAVSPVTSFQTANRRVISVR